MGYDRAPGVAPPLRFCLAGFCLVMCLAGCRARLLPPAERDWIPRRGVVDVVCRPGCSSGLGMPDTLFGCLSLARATDNGTVDLPPGVYLGHVAGFIVQALKYYDLEDHFERFYGCRIVLRFREAFPDEAASSPGLARLVTGSLGDAAVSAAGGPLVSVTPVLFLAAMYTEEAEIQRVRAQAEAAGLPGPTRSSLETVAGGYWDGYVRMWRSLTGRKDGRDAVSQAYVVEECFLERPGHGEPLRLTRPYPD